LGDWAHFRGGCISMNRNFVRKGDAGQRIIAIVNVVHQVVQSKGTDWVLPFELGQKAESTLMNVFCLGKRSLPALRQGDVIFTSNARTHYDSAGKKSLFGKIDGPIAARLDLRVFRQVRDVWNTGHYPIVTDAARQEINDLCNLAYPPLEAQPEIKVHAVSPTRPEVAVTMKRAVSTNVSTGKPNVSPQAKRKKTNHPVPVIILE